MSSVVKPEMWNRRSEAKRADSECYLKINMIERIDLSIGMRIV